MIFMRHLLPFLALFLGGPAAAGPPEMVRIPAGAFIMGSNQGEEDERPEHRRRLGAYLIDRHEVTRGRYARCVSAGACRAPQPLPGTHRPKGADNAPVVGVSWRDARAYCGWAGKRLPTEVEWERAARGKERRPFPWGAKLDCSRANFGNYRGAGFCAGTNPGRVLPVGSRPKGASPEGAQDLAGNVWEWVADLYRPYPGRPAPAKGNKKAKKKDQRVVRGGSCCSYFVMPRAANRLAFPPDYVDGDIGFRCAR